MKMNIKTVSAFVAFAATAFSVHAQTMPLGNIEVGFQSAASTQNLIIDVGSVSTLAGFVTETTIGNFDAQLVLAGFSNYATTQVNWGAAGTQTSPAPRVDYLSRQWTADGTLGAQGSTSWGTFNSSTINSGGAQIDVGRTGYNSAAAIATGDGLSKTILASNTNSWTKAVGTAASAFGQFGNGTTFFQNQTNRLAGDSVYSASDLYKVSAAGNTFLGTFALYTAADGNGHQAGDLTFTAVAIPEPSTYAAILGAVALAVVVYRRQRQAAALAA